MQALFVTGEPQRPLAWGEATTPELVDPTDALVRPLAVAACDLDRAIVERRSPFPGRFMIGHEFTGEIIDVGDHVHQLGVGDIVLASFQPSCGACSRCQSARSSVCGAVPNGTMYGIGATGGDWGGALSDAIRVPWAAFNLQRLHTPGDFRRLASASDNLADGLRCVEGPLQRNPEASVLIAGRGSIALYAMICAKHLGASEITVASDDPFVLDTAAATGATCAPVTSWPKRFAAHDVTVDCTNSVAGLNAVLRSTAPYGECTSASIFFGGPIPVPMFNLNMLGIHFHTGRVNSAADMRHVLDLVDQGLDPDGINPAYWPFEQAIEALSSEPFSRKVIVHQS